MPPNHPLWPICADALKVLSAEFETLYSKACRQSMKSSKPKDGNDDSPGPGRNGERDFLGEKRSNRAHASPPTPRRNCISECEAAFKLVDGLNAKGRIMLGADKAYDMREFVRDLLRVRKVTPISPATNRSPMTAPCSTAGLSMDAPPAIKELTACTGSSP